MWLFAVAVAKDCWPSAPGDPAAVHDLCCRPPKSACFDESQTVEACCEPPSAAGPCTRGCEFPGAWNAVDRPWWWHEASFDGGLDWTSVEEALALLELPVPPKVTDEVCVAGAVIA